MQSTSLNIEIKIFWILDWNFHKDVAESPYETICNLLLMNLQENGILDLCKKNDGFWKKNISFILMFRNKCFCTDFWQTLMIKHGRKPFLVKKGFS